MIKTCLVAILLAACPTLSLTFSKDVVLKGTEEGSNYTVIQFRVSQTNEKGEEWTCLRAEFSLDISLELDNKGYLREATNNTTKRWFVCE